MFVCDRTAGDGSVVRSAPVERVASMTGTAEDWQNVEDVAAGGTDGRMATCPCLGLCVWAAEVTRSLSWWSQTDTSGLRVFESEGES